MRAALVVGAEVQVEAALVQLAQQAPVEQVQQERQALREPIAQFPDRLEQQEQLARMD